MFGNNYLFYLRRIDVIATGLEHQFYLFDEIESDVRIAQEDLPQVEPAGAKIFRVRL